MRDKALIIKKMQILIEMTAGFCDKYLDNDYKELCEKLIKKMARKHHVPFLRGRMEIWASAIVYSIGRINFLFDKSFKPYITPDDICNYFGTSKSTTAQKAALIQDMFNLTYWNPEFSTPYMKENNPFSNYVMIDGVIMRKDSLPPEIRSIIEEEK